MPIFEAVRLALATIRVQKLKSFFTLLGVTIGVMFLVTVVSIVEGMSKYMEEDFAAKMLGVNTFTLRRMAWFNHGNITDDEWRAWQRRPRFYPRDVHAVRAILPTGTRYAVESQDFVFASTPYARARARSPRTRSKATTSASNGTTSSADAFSRPRKRSSARP